MGWQKYVDSDPQILFGKPKIKGARITVELILEKLGESLSEKELLESYPHITKSQIKACLQFAAHHLKSEQGFPAAS
tara:strand:+ start:5098 stop:5328 length:231 start_codon:yes stop_codon:yes gene_type:complete